MSLDCNSIDLASFQEGNLDTKTHRDHHGMAEAEIGATSQRTPRMDDDHRQLGRGKEGFYPESQKECGPADTLISTSSLQNCERINFCCFKPPTLW